MEFEAGTHLVLGKVQLGLGRLAGAVAGGKGARAPAAAATHFVQPVHLRAEAVAGRHEHHAVVHHVRQRCEATTEISVCPFLFNLRIAVNCTRYKEHGCVCTAHLREPGTQRCLCRPKKKAACCAEDFTPNTTDEREQNNGINLSQGDFKLLMMEKL